MNLYLKIEMNEKLYVRNPEQTDLGRRIVQHSIILIHSIGFEAFTFKKLAKEINTTEAGVYRYFENKHLLLLYIVDWYWSWQEYRLRMQTKDLTHAQERLRQAIRIISAPVIEDIATPYINETLLYDIIMSEGAKAYLTRQVKQYNEAKLFKPYKDFCKSVAEIVNQCNPDYKYPQSLATTIIEMAHSQNFYLKNLPSLVDAQSGGDISVIAAFLEEMVFSAIGKK